MEVGYPEVIFECRSAVRAPGPLRAEAGTRAAAPFPAPLSPLAVAFLRSAPDRFLLTKPNTFPHNRVASVATLRWCSGSSRNAVRLPFGLSVQLRRNPHHYAFARNRSTVPLPRKGTEHPSFVQAISLLERQNWWTHGNQSPPQPVLHGRCSSI